MVKPSRSAAGRDAAYTKVKQILPHCEDDDINAALQSSFGDAEQAVIALTSSGNQEWSTVDKKIRKKPAGRGADRPFERSDGPDRGYRDSSFGQSDERRRDRNGRGGSRGGRDADGPGGRGRGRGGGRGRGRGSDGGFSQPPARRDTSSPVRNYEHSPEPAFAADDDHGDNSTYAAPTSASRPTSRITPSQLPQQGSTWASKLKQSTAPAQPREPSPEPERELSIEQHADHGDPDDAPAAWGPPAAEQEPHSEDSGGHDAFADFSAPGTQHTKQQLQQPTSSWGQPVLHPDWSTQPQPSQSMKEGRQEATFDSGGAVPSSQQLDAQEAGGFDLTNLRGALPVGGYDADPPAPQYMQQASGGGGGGAVSGFGSGPVEPKKGEDHLPSLFGPPTMEPSAATQQDEPRAPYVPQSYSHFSQPQMATDQDAGQGSRPTSSAAVAPSQPQQPPPQAANLPDQLSQTPPQAQSASSQARGGPAAAVQAGAGGQRGVLSTSQAYETSYGGDVHSNEPPSFLSQTQKGAEYSAPQQPQQQGSGQGPTPGQGQQAPQQVAAPPHMQQQSPAQHAPQHMPQSHHGGKTDVSDLDGGVDKGHDGDMSQQHMQGQFAGHLPDMHGWGNMPQADMFGMRGSGHPGLAPGMTGMMQPGMQPGMPPNPQMPQQFMAPSMQGGYGYPTAGSNPGYQQMFPPPNQYMQPGPGAYNMSQGGYGGYAPPYGYAPQYPGASGPGGGYPSNGSSYGSKQYPGGDFARGASGTGAGGAPNSSGRSRGSGGSGRGGKQQPKGNRGGGSGNATPAGAFQPGMTDQFAPGPAMYGGGYDQWSQGQPRYDVQYGKDAKSMGGQGAYGYGAAGMASFDPSHAAAFQHQQPQYPGGGYQQQAWGSDKGFGHKGTF